MACSVEGSEFTSVLDRLTGHKARRGLAELGEIAEPTPEQREMLGLAREKAEVDAWLCPMGADSERPTVLEMSVEGYLALVEWTGRQLVEGKRGVLTGETRDIVDGVGLEVAAWVETVRGFGRMYGQVAGAADELSERARRLGSRRARGMASARAMYAGSGAR
jgi:hypothetical protein